MVIFVYAPVCIFVSIFRESCHATKRGVTSNTHTHTKHQNQEPSDAPSSIGISIDCLVGCFRPPPPCWKTAPLKRPINHEDVNGEKLTVKKWWIFLVPIFSRFTQSFSRFIRDIDGEKNISLLMIFFTVSFSRFTPSRTKRSMTENDKK